MKKHIVFGLLGAALLGAGCGPSDSPVSLDKYSTGAPAAATDQQASVPSIDTPATPPAADVAPEASSTAAATSTAATSTTPTNSSSSTTVTQPQAPLAFPGILPDAETSHVNIRLKTTKGDIVFELLPKDGPKAASNFVYLTKQKFYDGLTFHRIVPGFVIQGGDPQGTGMGGPGYKFEDDKVNLPKFDANPSYVTYAEGLVAMANSGPNTNGSQFFIMLANNPLPPSYSVFGRVVSGMDVVKKIQMGDVMTSVTIEKRK